MHLAVSDRPRWFDGPPDQVHGPTQALILLLTVKCRGGWGGGLIGGYADASRARPRPRNDVPYIRHGGGALYIRRARDKLPNG